MEKEDRSRGPRKHTLRRCHECNQLWYGGTFYVVDNENGNQTFDGVQYSLDKRKNWEVLEPEGLEEVDVTFDYAGARWYMYQSFHYEGKEPRYAIEAEGERVEEPCSVVDRREKKDLKQCRSDDAKSNRQKDCLRGQNKVVPADQVEDNSRTARKQIRRDLARQSQKVCLSGVTL
jgi:hypothetical protein